MRTNSGSGEHQIRQIGCATCKDAFQLLNNQIRHDIMLAIASAEQCTGALAERLDLDPPTISKHATLLLRREFLNMTKHGKNHIFSLGPTVRVVRVDEVKMLAIHCRDGHRICVSLNRIVTGGRGSNNAH